MINNHNTISLKRCMVTLFLFQLLFLPGRYYSQLNYYFWPLPHNIILLLSSLFVLYIFQTVKSPISTPRNFKSHFMTPVVLCILFFLSVQLISSLVNLPSSKRAAIDIDVYYITFYGPVLMLFLAYYFIQTVGDVLVLIKVLLLIVLAAIIVSILFAISSNLFDFVARPRGQRLFMYRLFIPSLGTTGLSQLISIALPLICSLYLFYKKRIYFLFLLAASLALLLTFGRWSIMVSTLSMLLYLFLTLLTFPKTVGRIFTKRMVTLVPVLGVLVIILFSTNTWMANFLLGRPNAVIDRTPSFTLRERSLRECVSFFSERPLFGYGPGEIFVRVHSQAKYPDYEPTSPYDIVQDMPHSTFAMILAEGGITSFASFILLLAVMLRMQLNNIASRESHRIIGIGLFVASFAFIVTMLFSNFDNRLSSAILFWLVQGMALGFNKVSRCYAQT